MSGVRRYGLESRENCHLGLVVGRVWKDGRRLSDLVVMDPCWLFLNIFETQNTLLFIGEVGVTPNPPLLLYHNEVTQNEAQKNVGNGTASGRLLGLIL